MKKTISVVALLSMFAAGSAYGSAFRIPEQSVDSTAKAGANIAGASGADASYYNPANMSWMDNTGWLFEGNFTGIYLSAVEYKDNRSSLYDHESEDEAFLLPTFFLVSPDYNDIHFGLSLTAPYGLAKRWKDGFGSVFAEKFSLQVLELNPTVSYKINEKVSLAAGVRALYSKATVASNGMVSAPYSASRFVEGDGLDFGWNAALTLKPNKETTYAVTYRSLVEMEIEGDARLWTDLPYPSSSVSTTGSVTVPAPAVLALSGAYDFGKAKVEFTFDRTYWSEWKDLDIDYDVPITNPILYNAFDKPAPRNWDDADAFRLSIEYEMDAQLTLMGGFAYDENPIPDETVDFSLPDSDAYLFSFGMRYALDESMEFAAAVLYDYKESRDVKHGSIDGEFSNASAILFTAGVTYQF